MNTIRVLQCVDSLDRGGIETWLVQMMRHIDRQRFDIEFLVNDSAVSDYESELREQGVVIHKIGCRSHRRPRRWAREFEQMIRQQKRPYDIFHAHFAVTSGWALRCAASAGFPVCIAHAHNTTTIRDFVGRSIFRTWKFRRLQKLMFRHVTRGIGCSEMAANAVFGDDWKNDPRFRVLHCGIDLHPFEATTDRESTRQSLGVGPNELLVGHVGRIHPQKNHEFFLKVAAEIVARQPSARFLLVGRGSSRRTELLHELAASLGIADRVIFAGLRSDVPDLLHAMDAFLFPSLYEGLPITLMESSASGLPAVCSDSITREADTVPGLIRYHSLDETLASWAELLLSHARRSDLPSREESLERMRLSAFNIVNSASAITSLYEQALHELAISELPGRVPSGHNDTEVRSCK